MPNTGAVVHAAKIASLAAQAQARRKPAANGEPAGAPAMTRFSFARAPTAGNRLQPPIVTPRTPPPRPRRNPGITPSGTGDGWTPRKNPPPSPSPYDHPHPQRALNERPRPQIALTAFKNNLEEEPMRK